MKCTQCGGKMDCDYDEVDIGVGTIRHLIDAFCPRCDRHEDLEEPDYENLPDGPPNVFYP